MAPLILQRRDWLAAPALILAGCAETGRPSDLAQARPAFPMPQGFPSPMVTRNNGIFLLNGPQQFLRGVAIPEVVWIATRNDEQMGFFDHRLFNAAAEWGCDILRLSVMPSLWRRLGEAHVHRVLDDCVAYARRCGLYLSICWHSIGFPPTERYKLIEDVRFGNLLQTSTGETHVFWRSMATRYGREPVVASFELLNEPQYINADQSLAMVNTEAMWVAWRDWCEQCTDEVRRIAPDKPVVVGGLQFGYDLSFAPDLPVRRANIIYATHPYPDSNWRLSWEEAFLAPGRRLPVMATEFGWDEVHHRQSAMRPDPATLPGHRYQEAIVSAFDNAAMGWQAWCFSHLFTPALLANSTFAPSGDFGAFIRNALRMRKTLSRG